MKIFFSGGGTLGPVTPLLALRESIQDIHPDATFFWVGTTDGPERVVVENAGVPFVSVASGKFRRYISLHNIIDIFRLVVGFFQSCVLLWKYDPDVCVSAGGYVSVPLHVAAWLFGVKTWVHQQDVYTGLANKLMVPFATVVTVTLQSQLDHFPKQKTIWLGNPVRQALFLGDAMRFRARFGIPPHASVVFATGGGTGSMKVNQLITAAAQHMQENVSIVHLSGLERPQDVVEKTKQLFSQYHVVRFFSVEEMADAYAAADIVVSRGGFGTISELAALKKCAILIPKPGHQEENVRFLFEGGAAQYVDERLSDGNVLAKEIKQLLGSAEQRTQMGERLSELLPCAKAVGIQSVLSRFV